MPQPISYLYIFTRKIKTVGPPLGLIKYKKESFERTENVAGGEGDMGGG
jgi:hypothetical protein